MQRDKGPPNVMMPKENPMIPGPGIGPPMQMNPMNPVGPMHMPPHAEPPPNSAGGWGKFQDSYLTFLSGSPGM